MPLEIYYINIPPDILKYHQAVIMAIDTILVDKIPIVVSKSQGIKFTIPECVNGIKNTTHTECSVEHPTIK